MENNLNNFNEPSMWGMISIVIVKSKMYIGAVLVALASSFVKYIQAKRNNEAPKWKDFLLFSVVASVVTLSGLALMQYLGMEIDFLAYMIMFWLGISTDYLYGFIERLIKHKGEQIINKDGEES